MGCVYILTNPAFKENWVKIGMSSREVDVRVKELDNTAVPLPFEIYAVLETRNFAQAEHHIHQMLDLVTDTRIRKSREFFNISPEKALEILNSVKQLLPDGKIKKFGKELQTPTIPTTSSENTTTTKNTWIIPASKQFFDLEQCFKDLGGVYWKQKNNFTIGDYVYVYSAKPDKCIKYLCRVDKCNVSYDASMENQGKYDKGNNYLNKDCKYAYIKYLTTCDSDNLTYSLLKEHGLKGTMLTGVKCSKELLEYINTQCK